MAVWKDVCAIAHEHYPVEVGGWILRTNDGIRLHSFAATASATQFDVAAQTVIDMAYRCKDEGWDILATFHSHPTGHTSLSRRDEMLRMWARTHLLAVRHQTGVWKLIIATSEFPKSESDIVL